MPACAGGYHEFRALPFYQKNGYQLQMTLDNFPETGSRAIICRKRFDDRKVWMLPPKRIPGTCPEVITLTGHFLRALFPENEYIAKSMYLSKPPRR